ncbi:hypothetical protein B0H13DRAFT_2329954 [Mycena leptocephala]|nr:hypothetical protein B0H13DRAFT_2329954 [Mycena leptocephala]
MLSTILAACLRALSITETLTGLQAPLDAGPPCAMQSGFYEIHNKAYDGQLVAFYRDELIVVLNNATAPKSADLGKWKVQQVSPMLYSIINVGLGVGLYSNDDDFITAGKTDGLFSIQDAGNQAFMIRPEEDDRFWTLYSFCEAEVHLDPELDDEGQHWEFRSWSQ